MDDNYARNNNLFKRLYERKEYVSEIVFLHLNRLHKGTLKNISLGGAYIEIYCVNQFSPEDIVTINIPFSTGERSIKCKGRIKWRNNEGFALEFI